MANKSKVIKFKPAGKNDNFIIVGTDINTIIEKEKFELKASEKGVKIEVLSLELTEGLSIKAYDGGKTKSYRKPDQSNSDREIG